jgi:hypothetical protein
MTMDEDASRAILAAVYRYLSTGVDLSENDNSDKCSDVTDFKAVMYYVIGLLSAS